MNTDSDRDIAEELEYIADNPTVFKKGEILVMLRKAAETIRDLRVLLDLQAAIDTEAGEATRKQ